MADFDDLQDKARRNLVTLSAVILASIYLKPKLAAKGQLFGFIDASEVDPQKAWIAVTAVLCYFAYRYWHSNARREAWKNWNSNRKQIVIDVITNRIERDVWRFHTNETPSNVVKSLGGEAAADRTRRGLRKVLVDLKDEDPFPAGSVIITWVYEHGSQDQNLYTYDYKGWRRRLLTLWAFLRTALVSDGTHELFIPFALAVLALVPCLRTVLPGLLAGHF